MRGILARAAAAATFVVLTATGAAAAGARIVWEHPGDVDRFKLFVAQPEEGEPRLMEIYIENPDVEEDGTFTIDVAGIDPMRPTFFLMVGITWQGFLTRPSNIIELGTEGFCEAFDVDEDGKVTSVDALKVARAAVGLGHGIVDDATVIMALEILRVASSFGCR